MFLNTDPSNCENKCIVMGTVFPAQHPTNHKVHEHTGSPNSFIKAIMHSKPYSTAGQKFRVTY